MKEYFTDQVQTILIFLLMGIFSVVARISSSDSKLSLRQKFNLFYVNIVAGWGMFSLLTSYSEWFGEFPQKVFTIMTVVYVGFNALEKLKKSDFLSKLVTLILNK